MPRCGRNRKERPLEHAGIRFLSSVGSGPVTGARQEGDASLAFVRRGRRACRPRGRAAALTPVLLNYRRQPEGGEVTDDISAIVASSVPWRRPTRA